jgi:MFS family permease
MLSSKLMAASTASVINSSSTPTLGLEPSKTSSGKPFSIITRSLLASISYLLYAFAPSWEYILLGAILTSFCWIYTPSFSSIVIESLPENRRGTGYSILNLISKASSTPSPLIAGYLYTIHGVVGASRISYVLVSAAFLAASLLRLRLVDEPDRPELTTERVLSSLGSVKEFTEGIGIWWEVKGSLRALFAVEMLYLVPNIMFNTILILYLVNDLGVTEVQLGQLFSIVGVAMIVLAVPSGKLVDRFGRVRPLLFSFALISVTLPILLTDASFFQLVLATPVIGLINIMFNSATQALWADLIPEGKRGRGIGSKSFFSLILTAIGSLVGGLVYEYISHTLPVYLYILINIPCFAITWLYIKDPERTQDR